MAATLRKASIIVRGYLLGAVMLLAVVVLAVAPTEAQEQPVAVSPASSPQDAAPRIAPECNTIAAIGDHGAEALRTADLARHGVPIDLGNKGHLQNVRVGMDGTAHNPVLTDANDQPLPQTYPDGWLEDNDVRFAGEVSVLKVNERFWEVAWDLGGLDNVAALAGATDGSAMCRFQSAWDMPRLKLMTGGEPSKKRLYWNLLLGRGHPAPSAGLDPHSVALPPDLGPNFSVGPLSWKVDLANSGHPMPLIAVHYDSGAGAGVSEADFGLVHNGKVIRFLDSRPGTYQAPIVPLSPALVAFLNASPILENSTMTPTLDPLRRAYVLVDNVKDNPRMADRMRLLIGMKRDAMWPIARLVWHLHNIPIASSAH